MPKEETQESPKVVRKPQVEIKSKPKLHIKVDADRMQDNITVDEMIDMQSGNYSAIKTVLSRFVWDAGNRVYKPIDEAMVDIGKLSIRQMNDLAKEFQRQAQDEAVPPASGPAS